MLDSGNRSGTEDTARRTWAQQQLRSDLRVGVTAAGTLLAILPMAAFDYPTPSCCAPKRYGSHPVPGRQQPSPVGAEPDLARLGTLTVRAFAWGFRATPRGTPAR